jgi:hypothetical protein
VEIGWGIGEGKSVVSRWRASLRPSAERLRSADAGFTARLKPCPSGYGERRGSSRPVGGDGFLYGCLAVCGRLAASFQLEFWRPHL